MKFLILTLISILLFSCTEADDKWVNLSSNVPSGLTARYDSCSFYDREMDAFYIIGGKNTNQAFNEIWKYSNRKFEKITTTGEELELAGRGGYCVFDETSKYLYMYGVNKGGNASPSKILRYGIGGAKITKLLEAGEKGLSSLRGHSLSLVTDQSIFGEKSLIIFGGEDAGGNRRDDLKIFKLDTKELIDLETTGIKPKARYGHAAVVIDGKLIIMGGYSTTALYDTYSLNLKTKVWKKLSDNTVCKDFSDTSVMFDSENKKVIMYGGRDKSKNPTDTFCEYDIVNDKWTKIDDSRPGKLFKAATSFGKNSLYIFGGNKLKDKKLKETDKFWRYDR